MIVNTEIRDALAADGQPCKQLVVSYINKEGGVSFLSYNIPPDQMFQWKYAKRNEMHYADPNFKSWDFKPVVRVPSNGYVSTSRIHEILLDLIAANPQVNVIHELNMPSTSYCDIEVDVDDEGFPDPDSVRNPVNTISYVTGNKVYVFGRANLTSEQLEWIRKELKKHCERFTTDYDFTYIYHEHEVDLLNDFFYNYMRLSPCVTGWNFFGYDWPYLYNRCEKLGISINYLSPSGSWYKHRIASRDDGYTIQLPNHKLVYDYMEIYAKWDRSVAVKETNKLDWVANTVLGVKKVEHQLGFKDFWRQQPAEYVLYNAIDSILIREIDNTIKTSSAFLGLANLMHVDALTAFSPVRSLEIVQTEYQYKVNKVFPVNGKKAERTDESYEGAFVFEPIRGIYKNVIALDFASLYPTTMRQFNISPDTFVTKDKNYIPNEHEIKCSSGAVYQKDFEGFIPKILTDFYKQRKAYKKEMMDAINEKYKLLDIYEKRFGRLDIS